MCFFTESNLFKNPNQLHFQSLDRDKRLQNQQRSLKKSEFVPKRRTSQLVGSITSLEVNHKKSAGKTGGTSIRLSLDQWNLTHMISLFSLVSFKD